MGGSSNNAKVWDWVVAQGIAHAFAAADAVTAKHKNVEVVVCIRGVTERTDLQRLPVVRFRMSVDGEQLDDRYDVWADMSVPQEVMKKRMTAVLANSDTSGVDKTEQLDNQAVIEYYHGM